MYRTTTKLVIATILLLTSLGAAPGIASAIAEQKPVEIGQAPDSISTGNVTFSFQANPNPWSMVIAEDQANRNGTLGILFPNEPAGRVTQCGLTNWQLSALFKFEVITWQTCDSSTSHSYTNLGLGQQRFHVRLHWPGVAYPSGVNSQTDSYSWSVGGDVPAVGMTEQPSESSESDYARFKFLVYAPNLNLSCQLDEQEVAACNDIDSPNDDAGHTAGKIIYENLANGTHVLRIRSTIEGTNRILKTVIWNVENRPDNNDLKTFLSINFAEAPKGNNYQAQVSIKNQSALSMCLENNTVVYCANREFTQAELIQELTPAELDLLWSNNPLIIPRLKQLYGADPILISAVELLRSVDEGELGYETLRNRVSGVEIIRDAEQCLGELQVDEICQFTLSVDLGQQPGETDVGYWRRLESYQAVGSLDIGVSAEYHSGNPADFSNPETAKASFFRHFNTSSPLQTLLNSAASKATADKCVWATAEPWHYKLILRKFDLDTFEEAYQASGCNPEPVRPERAYFPLMTKFPNFSRSGRVFMNQDDFPFSFRYSRNVIDFREASQIRFRWISAEQALEDRGRFENENDFRLLKFLFEGVKNNPTNNYRVVPPSSYQCRILLRGGPGPSDTSIVKRGWRDCSSGVTYDMSPLTGNMFYTLEVRGITKDGPSNNVSAVSWMPIDTAKCLISDVRTRFFIFSGQNAVRMVSRYRASKTGQVSVRYFSQGPNGRAGKFLGSLNAKFSRTDRKFRNGYKFFRIRQETKPALMRRLREQKSGFVAKLRVKNAPEYCNTYYKTDIQLTTLRRMYGQYVWFQRGSFKNKHLNVKPDFIPRGK
jgi:hypothetical protein